MTRQETVRGSVVIPAWNEAPVIACTLDALFDGIDPDSLEVVVVCNGCTDETARIVEQTGHPVTVVELETPGKAGALRAGDMTATTLPRIYLDADVALPGPSAVAVLDALADGAVAARPPVTYDLAGASWPVRAFFGVRADLPSVARGLYGAGVYGLSATARQRLGRFPDLVADDLFAARAVGAEEVTVVACAPVSVRVPADLGSLTHTLARVYRGNRELAAHRPDLGSPSTRATLRELASLGSDLRRWPQLATYLFIVVLGRARSRRRATRWERDHTSRTEVTTR